MTESSLKQVARREILEGALKEMEDLTRLACERLDTAGRVTEHMTTALAGGVFPGPEVTSPDILFGPVGDALAALSKVQVIAENLLMQGVPRDALNERYRRAAINVADEVKKSDPLGSH